MKYDPFANTARLQKKNMGEIVKFITLEKQHVRITGEDIDYESPITQILEQWADGTIKALNQSWIDKGFSTASPLPKSLQPLIIDKAGLLRHYRYLLMTHGYGRNVEGERVRGRLLSQYSDG